MMGGRGFDVGLSVGWRGVEDAARAGAYAATTAAVQAGRPHHNSAWVLDGAGWKTARTKAFGAGLLKWPGWGFMLYDRGSWFLCDEA